MDEAGTANADPATAAANSAADTRVMMVRMMIPQLGRRKCAATIKPTPAERRQPAAPSPSSPIGRGRTRQLQKHLLGKLDAFGPGLRVALSVVRIPDAQTAELQEPAVTRASAAL